MTTQAVRDKGAEHSRHELLARRIVSYVVLAFLCFLCLFFFYVLIINATRNHYQIQRGFSFLPGKSFTTNLKNVLADANIPILSGIKNSLVVAALSAILSIYFSALTAYGRARLRLQAQEDRFRVHHPHHDDADAGFRAGFPSFDDEHEAHRHADSAVPAEHRRADRVLFHGFLHEEQPADGNRGSGAHRRFRRIPHV